MANQAEADEFAYSFKSPISTRLNKTPVTTPDSAHRSAAITRGRLNFSEPEASSTSLKASWAQLLDFDLTCSDELYKAICELEEKEMSLRETVLKKVYEREQSAKIRERMLVARIADLQLERIEEHHSAPDTSNSYTFEPENAKCQSGKKLPFRTNHVVGAARPSPLKNRYLANTLPYT